MSEYITVIYPDGTETAGMPYLAVLGYVYYSSYKNIEFEVVEMSEDKKIVWVEPTSINKFGRRY